MVEESHTTLEYIPGNCNIGPEEIYRRRRIGYLGLAGMAIFIIIDLNFNFQQVWKLVLFAPTVYALSGFLQARQKFCFIYGFMGLSSISGRRYFTKSKDNLMLRKDRTKALLLVAQVFFGALVITLLYYFLS